MPINYQHNLNPLIGGAMAFLGGYGQAQAAKRDFQQQQILQQQQQRFQQQQATFGLVGNITSQQLAAQNRAALQLADFQQAETMFGLQNAAHVQNAMNSWSMQSLGKPWEMVRQEYAQNYAQSGVTLPEFINSTQMQYAARQRAMSLEQAGMEEYTPDQIMKPLEKKLQLAQSELDQLDSYIDSGQASPEEAVVLREQAAAKLVEAQTRIQNAPKLIRPKTPATMTFNDAVKQGHIYIPPQLQNRVVGTRDPRTGGWDVQVVREGENAQGGQPDPILAEFAQIAQNEDRYAQAYAQAQKNGPPNLPPPKRTDFGTFLKQRGIKSYNIKTGAIVREDDPTPKVLELQQKAQAEQLKSSIDAAKIQGDLNEAAAQLALKMSSSKNALTGQESFDAQAFTKNFEIARRTLMVSPTTQPAANTDQREQAKQMLIQRARQGDTKAQQVLDDQRVPWR